MRKPTQQATHHEFKQDVGMAGMAWVQTLMLAAVACAALLVVIPAEAAPASKAAAATARYEQDRAACMTGHTDEDRSTCLKEAGAAYADAKRGALKVEGSSGGAKAWAANAKKRCVGLPAEESKACLARMQGAGSTSGSVASGGILRELVTVQPAASNAVK